MIIYGWPAEVIICSLGSLGYCLWVDELRESSDDFGVPASHLGLFRERLLKVLVPGSPVSPFKCVQFSHSPSCMILIDIVCGVHPRTPSLYTQICVIHGADVQIPIASDSKSCDVHPSLLINYHPRINNYHDRYNPSLLIIHPYPSHYIPFSRHPDTWHYLAPGNVLSDVSEVSADERWYQKDTAPQLKNCANMCQLKSTDIWYIYI